MPKENAQTRWRAKNPEKTREMYRRNARIYSKSEKGHEARVRARNKRRAYIIEFFGGKCVHCGFDDPRALQMDHINGRNGADKIGNVDMRYKFLKENAKEARATYQMLCANCNFIKREVNKEHYYHGR